jgi:hypothetical protein
MASKEEKNQFSCMIETMALRHGISYLEAILDHCEKTGLEVEVAGTLVNASLKAKLEEEAIKLKFLPKSKNRLDI